MKYFLLLIVVLAGCDSKHVSKEPFIILQKNSYTADGNLCSYQYKDSSGTYFWFIDNTAKYEIGDKKDTTTIVPTFIISAHKLIATDSSFKQTWNR